jgi:autotransporter-associated beta strand protein
LAAAENAGGITFTTSGYTIANSGGSALTLASAAITLPDSGTETINCPLAGTTAVTVSPTTSGPSTLILGGANTYTGATTINSGATLTIGGTGVLNKGSYAGAITDNGAYIYNSSAVQTNSGTVSGAGPITVEGSGALTLSHANTGYTGSTTINPGSTLALTSISAVGSTTTITNNGTLDLFTGGTAQYSFAVGGSGVINFPIAYATASENDRFEGTVGLENFAGTVNVYTFTSTGATNGTGTIGSGQLLVTLETLSYPGVWNIGPGTTVAVPDGFTSSASVILNGPGNSQPYGALRLDGGVNQTGNILLNGNGITIGDDVVAPGPSEISGNIGDGGNNYGWAKAVGNPAVITTIILSGNNTYTGPTIFSSIGTLQVGSAETPGVSGPLGKSPASNPGNIVLGGATLQYSAANNYDYSGRFSTNAGQDYNIDVNGQSVTFAAPLISSGSELTLKDSSGDGILTLSGTNSYTGITTINSGTLNVSGSITGSTVINVNGGGILELSNSAALSSGAVLTLPSSPAGNSVNLNFSGTQTILGLYFGAVQQPAGTYSAISNNSSGAFTGTGTLNVAPQIFWDENGTDASSQSSANGGGSGSWDNTTADWWVSGSSDTKWVSNIIANFAGTTGTVTLNASEVASGLTFATDGYTITGSSNLTLAGTPTIALPNGGAASVNCPIAGTGGLTESGSGTLTLGGSNSFTGPVAVGGGCTLILGGTNAYAGTTTIGTGSTLTITNAGDLDEGNYPGAVVDGGTFNYNSSASQTLSGIISGPGSLAQTDAGMLTLSGVNLFNGPITIGSGGTLAVGGSGDLGNNVTFNTGGYSGAMNDNGTFVYNSSALQTISSGISGTGGLTLSGNATLTLSGPNSYTGVTMIGSGSDLILSASGYLGNGDYETNIINDGTLTFSSASAQIFGGVISGSGTLTFTGGSLTLSANNTYTGATAITSGTLFLAGSGSINDSKSISIAASSTFDVSSVPSPYTLGSTTALSATGTAGAPALLNGASSGIVNLGSQPISLTFAPQTFNGDTFDLALYITQGTLTLNGNVISVHISGGTRLGAGTYTLINSAGGNINGSATLGVISGAGLAAGNTASLSVSGANLNLVVGSAPAINSVSFSPGQLVLSGTNGPAGGNYYVLTSTNLALPLPEWTTNAQGAFSATGTFSATNTITASPSFFVIEVAP